MPSYIENALAAALNAVSESISICRAVYDYGILEATLRHCKTSRQPRTDAHMYRQKLSPIQKSRLAEWIHIQDVLGVTSIYTQIRTFASRILLAGGSISNVGKHWLENFLHRNLYIKTL